MTRKRTLLVAIAAAAGVLVATRLWTGGDPRSAVSLGPTPMATRQAASLEPAPPRAATPGRDWQLGLQYVHALELRHNIQLPSQGRAAADPDAILRLELSGELTQTVVDRVDDGFAVEVQLAPQKLAIGSGDGTAMSGRELAAMSEALRRPFYVLYSERGAVRVIHAAPDLEAVAETMIRAIVETTQVVLPAASEDRWTADELDGTGEYQASYRRDGATLEKRRASYLRIATPDGLQPISPGLTLTPRGRIELALDDRSWITTLTAELGLTATLGDMTLGDGDLELQLRALRHGAMRTKIGAFAAARDKLLAVRPPGAAQAGANETARLRRILAGASLPGLVSALRDASLHVSDDAAGRATATAMQRLRALFLLDPLKALDVPAMIGGETERNVYSSLLGSLSSASTPESIRALALISTDAALSVDVRVDAIAALGAVERPDGAGLAALDEVSRSREVDLRTTATLALGTTSRNLTAHGQASGDEVRARLLRDAATADRPADRALALGALANTRSAEILEEVGAALGSDSVEVRQAAVVALRNVPSAEADRLIAAAMVDPAYEVRRSAIFASSFRALLPLLPALTSAVTRDPIDSVRMDAVRLLGVHRNDVKEATALLGMVSTTDKNPEIRDAAAKFLAAAGKT